MTLKVCYIKLLRRHKEGKLYKILMQALKELLCHRNLSAFKYMFSVLCFFIFAYAWTGLLYENCRV